MINYNSYIATSNGQVFEQSIFEESSTQKYPLGYVMDLVDGRRFRYAQSGEALSVGKLVQCGADHVQSNYRDLTPTAASIGATTVTVTNGSTAITADQFKDGFFAVTDSGTGYGYQYKIKSNTAASASGTCTITLYDPIKVAITADSNIHLIPNLYKGVVIASATQSTAPKVLGVPPLAVTSGYYFWLQTGGQALVLRDASTIAVGVDLIASTSTAGAVMLRDQSLSTVVPDKTAIGSALFQVGAKAEYIPVLLSCDT